MAINYNDTRLLMAALKQSYKPQTLFRDTFFPTVKVFNSKLVDIEYKKGGRKLAPFVAKGVGGVNVARSGSNIKSYEPPMIAPKRTVTVENLENRGFGEDLFSEVTPEQRAMILRGEDMAELMDMNIRRMEWMCAQLMLFGTFNIYGYSDDGETYLADTVTLDWTQKDTLTEAGDIWSNTSADIYGNLQDMSQTVSRNSGAVPTVGLCSFKTSNYILNNTSLLNWMLRPRENMSLMNIAPRITSPGVMRIGIIESLNLELYAYDAIYTDDSGATQQFLPDDYFIMGVPGRGKQLFGAITQRENGAWKTYAGAYVPKVWGDDGKDKEEIRVASKGLPIPEFIDDWYTMKVK